MERLATVTHVYTKGFVEIDLEGTSAVAETGIEAHRGDQVAVTPDPPPPGRRGGLAYLMPLVLGGLGLFLGLRQGRGLGESLGMALILGGLTLATAWLMNRPARLRRRRGYRVVRICQTTARV